MKDNTLTLGSLFDGSGGFPLAGILSGIKPVWASEIEPFPIRVTTRRLPDVRHYGDITKIHGSEIEPVDIITFGSPCQDMSQAGKRDGLGGSRSSLFFEAIRIVKEMREATEGKYPRYLVWENVPGAYSSNKGKDFHAVIQEFVKIKHPESTVPESEKWSGAGLVLAEDFSLAWRTLDAQHWGVPQRRRRIYLVADLDGERAGNILFESEGLPWNPEACGLQGKGSAGSAAEGIGEPGSEELLLFRNHAKDFHYEGPLDTADTLLAQYGTGGNNAPFVVGEDAPRTFDIRLTSEGTRNARHNVYETDTSRTIDTGGNSPDANQGGVAVVYGISSDGSNAMRSANPKAGIYVAETTRTLDANGGNPACNQGGMVVVEGNGARPSHKGDGFNESDKMYTLNTIEQHGVAYGIGKTALSSSFNSEMSFPIEAERMPTMVASGPNGVGHPIYSTSKNTYHTKATEDQAGTLVASDYKDPPTVTDPSFGFYPQMKAEGNSFTEEKSPTLVIGTNPGWQNGVLDKGYIVRRLTPTECARLQGFPDWWCSGLETKDPTEEEIQFWRDVFLTHSTALGKVAKPKSNNEIMKWLGNPHTDSAEYKMWGNGIALPCARYVLTGIAHYDKEIRNEEICDS